MGFIDSLRNRYTTKVYDSNKKVDSNKIEQLKEALRLSPSSLNTQPWKFTFVSDQKTKVKLAKASLFNHDKIVDCDTLIVFSRIDNLELFEQQLMERFDEVQREKYMTYSKPLPESEIKSWMTNQVYISLGVCMSACAELEIDSTPMEGIEKDKYDTILEETDYKSLFAVALGGRADNDFNRLEVKPKSRYTKDQVIREI